MSLDPRLVAPGPAQPDTPRGAGRRAGSGGTGGPASGGDPGIGAAATDAELVRRTRGGDREAAEVLARRCREPAYVLALHLLRNREDALDVAQDALLRFFSTLDRLQLDRPVRPWLLAIVRNRARDLQRRRRVRDHRPTADDDPEGGVLLVDPAPRPDADAARSELQARVWRALARLPENHREVLVLRDYQDLSYQEIATVLRVPMGTVMSRLHRARRALRDRLAGDGATPGDLRPDDGREAP